MLLVLEQIRMLKSTKKSLQLSNKHQTLILLFHRYVTFLQEVKNNHLSITINCKSPIAKTMAVSHFHRESWLDDSHITAYQTLVFSSWQVIGSKCRINRLTGLKSMMLMKVQSIIRMVVSLYHRLKTTLLLKTHMHRQKIMNPLP